jgi:hypothetical protein
LGIIQNPKSKIQNSKSKIPASYFPKKALAFSTGSISFMVFPWSIFSKKSK